MEVPLLGVLLTQSTVRERRKDDGCIPNGDEERLRELANGWL